jgi:hypothetical protein
MVDLLRRTETSGDECSKSPVGPIVRHNVLLQVLDLLFYANKDCGQDNSYEFNRDSDNF